MPSSTFAVALSSDGDHLDDDILQDDEHPAADAAAPDLLGDGDDDALQVALAFMDEFQTPLPASSTTTSSGLSDAPPPLLSQELVLLHQHTSAAAANQAVQAATMEGDGSLLVLHPNVQQCSGSLLASSTLTTSSALNFSSSSKTTQLLIKSSSGGSGAKVPATKTSNKARDGRKEELIYLRKKVSELELQLAENKKKKRKEKEQNADTDTDMESPQSSSSLLSSSPRPENTLAKGGKAKKLSKKAVAKTTTSVWQEIVSRQYNQRVKAERENIRLKLVLENQLKIAKSLEKVLQKTTSPKDFEKLIYGKRPSHSRYYLPSQALNDPNGGRRLFGELLAGMDQSYAEAESVFEANGLARMETSYIDAVIRSDESVGIQLEVFANKVLPFDMRAAGSVVWHHYAFAKERMPNRVYHHNSPQTLNATEDTIIEDFNLEVDVNSATAVFHVKLVMRRYTEESRIVIVWRAFFDPLRIADEPTPGVRFLERGYIVIKNVKGESEAQAENTNNNNNNNVLQTCYISTPVMTGDLADADSSTIRTITDFVLGATAGNISSSHEMIENVLLEHAIKAQLVG